MLETLSSNQDRLIDIAAVNAGEGGPADLPRLGQAIALHGIDRDLLTHTFHCVKRLESIQVSESSVAAASDSPASKRLQVSIAKFTEPYLQSYQLYDDHTTRHNTALLALQAIHAAVAANLPVFVFHPAEQ